MGLFDFLSTPSPDKAAMTPGDQTNQSRGLLSSVTPEQGQMLMALGQGLLSQRGMGAGLAAGLQGASDVAQTQQKLAAQKEQNDILNQIKGYNAITGRMGTEARVAKLQQDVANGNKPKFLTKVGDTIIMQGADGKPEPYTDAELQAAFGREYAQKLGVAVALNQAKQTDQNLSASEQKMAKENRADLQAAEQSLDSVNQVLDEGKSLKPGVGTQLAGLAPGVTSVASGFSSDAGKVRVYQQKLQNVLVSDWLTQGLKLRGAQSDKEGAALKSRQPLLTDDYETVIKPWLENVQKWMQDSKRIAEENIAAERKPGVSQAAQGSGAAPAASGGLPAAALGALREGQETTFNNGQVWTLEGGKAKRIK